MRMLALLTGLTVATVFTGMVPANWTASETSVALADQNGTCVDCAIRQPIKDSEIPQEPRDDGCSGCADRQPTEPTICRKGRSYSNGGACGWHQQVHRMRDRKAGWARRPDHACGYLQSS